MALTYGDSKTLPNAWQPVLAASIPAQVGFSYGPSGTSPLGVYARGGQSMAALKAAVDADLAGFTSDYFMRYVLVNATVNGWPDLTNTEADLAYIVDAFHAKFPLARVYIVKPWMRGQDAAANTFAAEVDNILSTRAWASVGHDERVWLKGADDGAAMTVDGVHYSTAGINACAAQWKAILGY